MERTVSSRFGDLDNESLRQRLCVVFGEEGAERVVETTFPELGGRTPQEIMASGTDNERTALGRIVTFAETPPWYVQTLEAQQD
ncbi:MAG TPA: hypothetical protein VMR34_06150 [Candidatus Saccharimonadales bacterium]|nr:hypothetical protein [Candidatus Saccharimonadales bacterium]